MSKVFSPISHLVFYVWLRNAVSYKRYILPTFLASIGEPLLYLVAIGIGLGSYMGMVNGMPYLHFIAPGLVVSAVMFSTVFECTYSSMVRMTIEKVYNSQLVTPVSIEEIVTGEILWGMTRGMMSGTIMLVVLLIFGIGLGVSSLLYPLLWLAVGFLFASLSMLMTSFAKNFDFFTYYFQLFISPMFFFSGIFFPLDHFPESVQLIAQFLPLTHAVTISRMLVEGRISASLIEHFFILLVPAILLFVFALKRMKKRIIK
jgi:lipooligosaccharide transport system permease protein